MLREVPLFSFSAYGDSSMVEISSPVILVISSGFLQWCEADLLWFQGGASGGMDLGRCVSAKDSLSSELLW